MAFETHAPNITLSSVTLQKMLVALRISQYIYVHINLGMCKTWKVCAEEYKNTPLPYPSQRTPPSLCSFHGSRETGEPFLQKKKKKNVTHSRHSHMFHIGQGSWMSYETSCQYE